MQSLFINWIISAVIIAAVATYTPLVHWGFKFGVFDYVLETVRDLAFSKVVKGTGSLEDFSNKLTGSRSHWVYGPRLVNPNDKVEDWRWEPRENFESISKKDKARGHEVP